MGIVRLGKMVLRWCHTCNLPILDLDQCGSCSSKTTVVTYTPPGDIRPAFDGDLALIRKTIDRQFGPGTGVLLIPDHEIVVLNRAPDIDRMDEIIINGEVVGALRYEIKDPDKLGNTFITRLTAAARILPKLQKGWVKLDEGVDTFILKGASVLLPGVLSVADNIEVDDEIIVLDVDGEVVATGRAKMSSPRMREGGKGIAVKTRWHGIVDEEELPDEKRTWSDVIAANRPRLDRLRSQAYNFIHKVIAREGKGLPIAVSFSGGKDSLATLLLVLEAGLRPPILFVDTGLEFPETIEHVNRIAKQLDLDLITEHAGESFWKGVDQFGPPGKDYRWCCKSCKLGPATRLILRSFPNGVLSFIGQRKYESITRASSKRVWRNPWVPGQLGASPIQSWTALDVWLYLFSEGIEYNPWYDRGLERIGCWLCPASDMADLEVVKHYYTGYQRWAEYLRHYARTRGYDEAWLTCGLWRWKKVPKALREVEQQAVADPHARNGGAERAPTGRDGESEVDEPFTFYASEGYSPCVGGISIEGAFSQPLDRERCKNLLNILGAPEFIEGHIVVGAKISVFPEGAVTVNASSPTIAKALMEDVRQIIFRAMLCVGCGVCLGRCEAGALSLDGTQRVVIDERRCKHCKQCLGPCPVIEFRRETDDGFLPREEEGR